MRNLFTFCWIVLLATTSRDLLVAGNFEPAKQLRRPIAMALSADESLLYVANRDSGTVSILDAEALNILNEVAVGEQLSDIARIDARYFLATDNSAHQLILLRREGKSLEVVDRLPVRPYPLSVAVTTDGKTAYFSSLWSRSLTVVELTGDGDVAAPSERAAESSPPATSRTRTLSIKKTIDLTFAPNKLLLVEDEKKLIVADHFAGRFGIFDCERQEVIGVRTFFAENIRGLGIDPRSKLLAVSHTMLNEYAHTVRNDVHWGVLMSNDLRWLQPAEVLDPDGDFYNKGHMHPLGEPGMGGGNPGELDFFADGTIVVPMTGVNKVAFGKEGDFGMHRLNVPRGPTSVIASDQHGRAFVACTFDDSISVVDIEKREVVASVPLGPKVELTLAQRGELLFHDGRLSHDGWMTCNTCHTDGHTNGGQNDNFSDKSFGAPKRVLSLLGSKETAPYAWNGQTETLEDQIRRSNQQTMHGREMSDPQVTALAAYVRTLDLPRSVDALRGTQVEKLVTSGKEIFHARDCTSCHTPPLYTSADAYDVGLTDKQGNKHFNPPSLRGISHRGPYFHDVSAKTLESVFTEHGHQLDGKSLSNDELKALVAFLRSL